MHAHAVFAAQASFISIARKGAAANDTNNNDNDSHHHAVVKFRNNGVSKRSSSSSSSLGGVATRAASGGEAGSSSSSSSAQQREQKPGYSQNAAIKLLGDMDENPWSVNTYHSKRATHKVNELGDIIGEDDAPENILEQPGWDDAGKLRFCVSTVAAELDLPEEEVGEKMRQLFTLAPGIERRVGEVKVADIVRMVASLPDVAAAFLKLRTILPAADLVWGESLCIHFCVVEVNTDASPLFVRTSDDALFAFTVVGGVEKKSKKYKNKSSVSSSAWVFTPPRGSVCCRAYVCHFAPLPPG